MKLKIYAVRDRATDQYGNPMFMLNTGQAIRGFSDEVNRAEKDNQLHHHAEDFDLYELGVFDTDTGIFETETPRQIAIGKDIKRS